MAANPNAYTISSVLLGLEEDAMRLKGRQGGTMQWKGGAWYIAFREWRADERGNLVYLPTSRRVEGDYPNTERGRRAALRAGQEQHIERANAGSKVVQGLATVGQFYETRFEPDHVALLKKTGRMHYRTMWQNHVRPTLGAVQMREVTPRMVQQLVSAKVTAGFASQTIYHIRAVISAIFNHAMNLGFFDGRAPTQGIKLPELTHRERQALTWEQVLMLAATITPRYRHLIILLAQTGMRIGEAFGLTWQCVNLTDEWRIVDGIALEPNAILVSSAWVRGERTTTKSRKWRKIPLTAESWVALTLQYEMSAFQGEEHPVFASRTGTPLSSHWIGGEHLKPAARKIGLPWISFHSLRHTTATLADKAGLTQDEKRKILGHATSAMTTHYTHPELGRVREAMERIGKGQVQ